MQNNGRQPPQSWMEPAPGDVSQQGAPTPSSFSTVSPPLRSPADGLPASTPLPPEARFAKPSLTSNASGFGRNSRASIETSLALAHAERLGSATTGSWKVRDIHWGFVFRAQHYGTLFFTLFIVIALASLHWRGKPRNRGYFLYDPSISYQSAGNTVPSAVAILVPFASLIISLCAYEFWVYKLENWHITNAVATVLHFLLDSLCAFVTVETFSEATKIAAGRLRPDFFQQCKPDVDWTSGPVQLGQQLTSQCTANYSDGRRSFVSSHASTSAVLVGYNIVYLIWAGYIRGGDAAFMGLDKRTGWRGGHRLLRELGHGVYLLWILLNFTFVWAVGVSRFTDNKHNISDIEGGWLLGFAFALIYATRSACLHKYVIMHGVRGIDELQRASQSVSGLPPAARSAVPAL
ncbi:hypothetical protein ABBQ32_004861 [Trebouxia sp. C0010 RCD-2024]